MRAPPVRQLSLHTEPGLWPPTWPMGLTMLRLLLLPVFLFLLLLDVNTAPHRHRWWAVGIFAIMAATDKLDGYLARKLNQTSRIGTLLDPVADKLLIACSVILLSFDWAAPPGYAIPKIVVALIYTKDVVIALGSLTLLYLVGRVIITPRPFGKAGTFLQLALILATLLASDLSRISAQATPRLIQTLWWSVSLISIGATIDYFVQGVKQGLAGLQQKKLEPQKQIEP